MLWPLLAGYLAAGVLALALDRLLVRLLMPEHEAPPVLIVLLWPTYLITLFCFAMLAGLVRLGDWAFGFDDTDDWQG